MKYLFSSPHLRNTSATYFFVVFQFDKEVVSDVIVGFLKYLLQESVGFLKSSVGICRIPRVFCRNLCLSGRCKQGSSCFVFVLIFLQLAFPRTTQVIFNNEMWTLIGSLVKWRSQHAQALKRWECLSLHVDKLFQSLVAIPSEVL